MNTKPKMLIVDDDEAILRQLKWALEEEYEIITASSKEEAFRAVEACKPQIVALDVNLDTLNMSGKEGIEILAEIKGKNPFLKVIMITGNESKELALEAVNRGATDFFLKPIDVNELKVILKRVLHVQQLEMENRGLQQELERKSMFSEMVGTSVAIEDVFKLIRRVAPTEATVLVTGESGTGKELVARAIHEHSARKDNPFVVINCGAIPENLLESELFGHEKGAFTDAHVKRIGKFETAGGGTIFLDEIGELSLNLQVKLLRFLQNRIIERVGGNTPIELDVRVIAATNQNLQTQIKDGHFREDLYYRLSVITITVPPLRERPSDIMTLAQHFMNRFAYEVPGKVVKGFSKDAKEVMKKYAWPGNVRELENKVRRALILAEEEYIYPFELGFSESEISAGGDETLSLKDARIKIEKNLIIKALHESKGNMTSAAKMLGITRPTLYDLMKKYDIELKNQDN